MLKKIFAALLFFASLSFVGTASALTPPAPSTTTSCSQNVTTFSAFKRCATGSGMDFLEASFKCASFAETQKISRGYCVNYYDLYQTAVDSCKNACVTPSASVPVTSSIAPSASPSCRAQELATYKFDGACPEMVDNKPQYNFINYKCGDETEYRRMGSADSCQWGSSLIDGAQFYCRKNTCTSQASPRPSTTSTPSPVTTTRPTPTPTLIPSPSSSAPIKTSVPSPSSSSCAKSLSSWKYKEVCNKQPLSYRYFDYQCMGETTFVSLGSSATCNTESTWLNLGREACRTMACSTPIPTQTPKIEPKPVISNPPSLCAAGCYITKWSQKSRVSCLDVCRGI